MAGLRSALAFVGVVAVAGEAAGGEDRPDLGEGDAGFLLRPQGGRELGDGQGYRQGAEQVVVGHRGYRAGRVLTLNVGSQRTCRHSGLVVGSYPRVDPREVGWAVQDAADSRELLMGWELGGIVELAELSRRVREAIDLGPVSIGSRLDLHR
jgi:hypothetical protein